MRTFPFVHIFINFVYYCFYCNCHYFHLLTFLIKFLFPFDNYIITHVYLYVNTICIKY
nr:MAG TPA: protein of unknown function (DUF4187) [Caudoviricetes sp.]